MTFSISVRAPIIFQDDTSFHERLDTEAEQYTITADVGYDKASFLIRGNVEYLKAWFVAGLVRDVIWIAPDARKAWQGYVSKMTMTIGASTRIRALSDLANRIYYVYTALDTSTSPPTTGAQATITSNDTDSQSVYGIKSATKSGGEIAAATATTNAAALLDKRARVWEDGSDSFRGGKEPSLKVDMLGYAWMMDWFNYSNSSSGTVTRDALIKLIAAADPNSILSTDYTNVDANSDTMRQYYSGDRTSWALIQKDCNAGTGGLRWVTGVYEGRKLTYKQAEGIDSNGDALNANKHTIITRSIYDAGERFFDAAGRELRPWHIRPDRLVRTAGLSRDPQYIETVSFSAPVGLEIRGTDSNPFRQMVLV
jgi:hypothetical protein